MRWLGGSPRRSVRALRRKAGAWFSEFRWRRETRPLPLPDHLVPLHSTEGARLLAEADPVGHYRRLSPWFETQETPTFCGPTTMAIMLNMLHNPEAADRFTQRSVFNDATNALKPRDEVVRHGMGLTVFADYLAAHAVHAAPRYARDLDVDAFRAEAVAVLKDPDRGLAVNYLRSALGQEGRGHLSPLAGFHPGTDRFLVLDVSRYRYSPVWVRAADLFAAMNTDAGKRSRGYIIAARH